MPDSTRETFDDLRPLLFSIAYRMLASASDAEDIVQDAFIRYQRALVDGVTVESTKAYLAAMVTRLAIDQVRSARARRETYVGQWLPEPVITEQNDPSSESEQAESISMAVSTSRGLQLQPRRNRRHAGKDRGALPANCAARPQAHRGRPAWAGTTRPLPRRPRPAARDAPWCSRRSARRNRRATEDSRAGPKRWPSGGRRYWHFSARPSGTRQGCGLPSRPHGQPGGCRAGRFRR